MTVTNPILLGAYATIADYAYDETATIADVSAGSFGTYTELVAADKGLDLKVPWMDDPTGFQARAFFNETTNELVIAFTGTEGFPNDPAEFLPDFLADFSLAVAGVSPQGVRPC